MARTTAAEVQAILLDNYDGTSSLTAFIKTANIVVNRLSALDSDSVLDADTLEEIECYLAAHYYAHADQLKQAESTGRSSMTYQGQTAMGFRSTQYGQTALELDFSGNLSTMGKKQPSLAWLGKPPSEQTDYEDRD